MEIQFTYAIEYKADGIWHRYSERNSLSAAISCAREAKRLDEIEKEQCEYRIVEVTRGVLEQGFAFHPNGEEKWA